MVQVGLEMRKYRDFVEKPNVAGDYETFDDQNLTLELEIRRKLGWASADQSFSYSLPMLLDRISESGIKDPNSYLTLDRASALSDIPVRTLLKLIAQGKLVRGDHSDTCGHTEIYVPSLFRVVLERERMAETELTNSEAVGREVVTLCHMIAEHQKNSVQRTDELLEVFRHQRVSFEALRDEQRQTFEQMYRFSTRMISTFATQRKASVWKTLFSLQ